MLEERATGHGRVEAGAGAALKNSFVLVSASGEDGTRFWVGNCFHCLE